MTCNTLYATHHIKRSSDPGVLRNGNGKEVEKGNIHKNGLDRASEIDVEASNYIQGKRKIQLHNNNNNNNAAVAADNVKKKRKQYDNHSE